MAEGVTVPCPPRRAPPLETSAVPQPHLNFLLGTQQEHIKSSQCNLQKCSSAFSMHKILCEWKQAMYKRQATLNYSSLYRNNALPLLFCSEVVDVIVLAVNALPYYEQSGWYTVTEGTVPSSFLTCILMLSLPPLYFFEWHTNTNTWKQNPESSDWLWSEIILWTMLSHRLQ